MASLWKLPLTLMCKNHSYVYSSMRESTCTTFYTRGSLFSLLSLSLSPLCFFFSPFSGSKEGLKKKKIHFEGDYVPGLWVNGADVLATRRAFEFARDFCASGKGPIVIEAATSRHHFFGNHSTTKEEVDQIRKGDPLEVAQDRLLFRFSCSLSLSLSLSSLFSLLSPLFLLSLLSLPPLSLPLPLSPSLP